MLTPSHWCLGLQHKNLGVGERQTQTFSPQQHLNFSRDDDDSKLNNLSLNSTSLSYTFICLRIKFPYRFCVAFRLPGALYVCDLSPRGELTIIRGKIKCVFWCFVRLQLMKFLWVYIFKNSVHRSNIAILLKSKQRFV